MRTVLKAFLPTHFSGRSYGHGSQTLRLRRHALQHSLQHIMRRVLRTCFAEGSYTLGGISQNGRSYVLQVMALGRRELSRNKDLDDGRIHLLQVTASSRRKYIVMKTAGYTCFRSQPRAVESYLVVRILKTAGYTCFRSRRRTVGSFLLITTFKDGGLHLLQVYGFEPSSVISHIAAFDRGKRRLQYTTLRTAGSPA